MAPGDILPLWKLKLFFYRNPRPVGKALFQACELDVLAFSYKTQIDNPGKLDLYLLQTLDKDLFTQVKKYRSLKEKYEVFTGKRGLEIEEAKSLIDNDLTCGSTSYVNQDKEIIVLKSPKKFSSEITAIDKLSIGIMATKQSHNVEILEKKIRYYKTCL